MVQNPLRRSRMPAADANDQALSWTATWRSSSPARDRRHPARRLSRSGERQLHRRIEAVDSFGVAACRVLLRALSLSNKGSIVGSCDERGSVCSGTPIRAGARPAERVAGQCRAPGEPSTQPVRRCCPALAGAKPAGTTDSPHSPPPAQLAHALRGAPVISETAPARHRHRSRPSGRTVLTHHPIPVQLVAAFPLTFAERPARDQRRRSGQPQGHADYAVARCEQRARGRV